MTERNRAALRGDLLAVGVEDADISDERGGAAVPSSTRLICAETFSGSATTFSPRGANV